MGDMEAESASSVVRSDGYPSTLSVLSAVCGLWYVCPREKRKNRIRRRKKKREGVE